MIFTMKQIKNIQNVETNNDKNIQYVLSCGVNLWEIDYTNNIAKLIFIVRIKYETPSEFNDKLDFCGNIIKYLNGQGYEYLENLNNNTFTFKRSELE
jgi:hypothetical protein